MIRPPSRDERANKLVTMRHGDLNAPQQQLHNFADVLSYFGSRHWSFLGFILRIFSRWMKNTLE